jgi:chromosome segregation ATPase
MQANSVLESRLQESELEISSLKEKNSLLEPMIREFQKQHEIDEVRISELTQQIDSLNQLQAEHLTTVDALQFELTKLRQTVASLEEASTSAAIDHTSDPEPVQAMKQTRGEDTVDLREIERLNGELVQKRKELLHVQQQNESERKKLTTDLSTAKDQLSAADNRIADLTATIEKLAVETKTLKKQVSDQQLIISLFDVEKMSLTGKISELEASVHSAKSTHMDQFVEFQNQATERLSTIQALTAERDQAHAELARLQSDHSQLSSQLSSAQSELSNLRKTSRELSASNVDLTQQLGLANARLAEKTQECEVASQQLSELTATSRASDKENKTLKSLLQRSLDSDQRNQQRIGQLQAEIESLSQRLTSTDDSGSQALRERVVQLEQENQALERRLSEARPNADSEAKSARLAAMLEKANLMWSEAVAQNKELTGRIRQPAVSLSLSLWAGESVFVGGCARPKENGNVVNAYLRTTLIQFFGQDANRRGELVPLILQLVGCTEQQVKVAQRQWERSNQLIQKTTGLFRF